MPGMSHRVFPAQAGVFLTLPDYTVSYTSLPRAGGGVSFSHILKTCLTESSPRRRGCFQVFVLAVEEEEVFPAQAGVFPFLKRKSLPEECLPRAGGGVSNGAVCKNSCRKSSPRRRGCFSWCSIIFWVVSVFPAQAGVFLLQVKN